MRCLLLRLLPCLLACVIACLLSRWGLLHVALSGEVVRWKGILLFLLCVISFLLGVGLYGGFFIGLGMCSAVFVISLILYSFVKWGRALLK
jgi:hypothetical protein